MAAFVPPDYTQAVTDYGYGYANLNDQIRDALLTYQRGAGNVGLNGGNNLPRYAFGNRQPPPAQAPFNAMAFLAPYLAAIKQPGGSEPPYIPPGVSPPPGQGLLGGGAPAMASGGMGGGLLRSGSGQGLDAMIAQALAASGGGTGRQR